MVPVEHEQHQEVHQEVIDEIVFLMIFQLKVVDDEVHNFQLIEQMVEVADEDDQIHEIIDLQLKVIVEVVQDMVIMDELLSALGLVQAEDELAEFELQ